MQRNRAQDHRGEVRAHDFRIRKGRTAVEVVFVVKPDADALGHAAAAACALIGGSLAHGLDEKLLDLRAVGIALHARESRIDDVADAGHRHGGFGDIRCKNDAPQAPRGLEDPVLFGSGQASVKRQDVRLPDACFSQPVGGVTDFALAREEHQNVAPARDFELRHGVVDRGEDLIIVLIRILDRPVADFHRIGATGNREHRSVLPVLCEVFGKALGVDRRRRYDHLEVGALRQEALQVPEKEVDIDRALVRFVDDDGVVGAQERIPLRFRKENAVRHELDRGARSRMVRKAHLEANNVAGFGFEFLGNAPGDRARGNAARLRMPDPPRLAAPGHKADFRELSRFARTRFAADDDHLVFFNCPDDLGRPLGYREPRHEFEGRNRVPAFGKGELLPPAGASLRFSIRPLSASLLGTRVVPGLGTLAGTRFRTSRAGAPGFGRPPAFGRTGSPAVRIRARFPRRLRACGSSLILRSLPNLGLRLRVLPVFCRSAASRLAEHCARSRGRVGEHGAEGALRRRKLLRLLRGLGLCDGLGERLRRGGCRLRRRLRERDRGGLLRRLCRRNAGALQTPLLKARGFLGRTLFGFLAARFLERLIHICAHLLEGREKSTVVRHENPENSKCLRRLAFGKETAL